MPLKKDSSASYDKGTGKYQTLSEKQGVRELAAPGPESTERVAARSESGPTTVTADTNVGPREKAVASSDVEDKAVAPKKASRKRK